MLLIGIEYIQSAAEPGWSAKMVFNDRGAIFFSVKRQHREAKAEGISYEDNYKGNALAAMLVPGKIEIRFHKAFSDSAVTDLVRTLLTDPRLSSMSGWQVTYQGRRLSTQP